MRAGNPVSGWWTSFLRGARDIAPVMASTVPFAIIYGALAAKQGLSLAESVGMSGLVYAGAAQFVALQLWAHPLPFWAVLLAVLAVNLRHVLYSAALGRKMTHWSSAERSIGFAFLTDPTFALAELKGGARLDAGYYFGLSLPLYGNWVVMSAVGAVFGNWIGDPAIYGLDFIVTAYFIPLVASFRTRNRAWLVIATSAAASLGVYVIAGTPWHIGAGALAGMIVAASMPVADRTRPAAP